mmetsp:Transcript_7212/g.23932  ORF Transcript_7212/g.23932 Transcript_7212/m.23932 type:complete len:203 (+) Transcript_7212:435-1043(+)
MKRTRCVRVSGAKALAVPREAGDPRVFVALLAREERLEVGWLGALLRRREHVPELEELLRHHHRLLHEGYVRHVEPRARGERARLEKVLGCGRVERPRLPLPPLLLFLLRCRCCFFRYRHLRSRLFLLDRRKAFVRGVHGFVRQRRRRISPRKVRRPALLAPPQPRPLLFSLLLLLLLVLLLTRRADACALPRARPLSARSH